MPVSNSQRNDILTTINRGQWNLLRPSDEIKNDREIILAAVRLFGRILKDASVELQNDREIVLAAVNEGNAHSYTI